MPPARYVPRHTLLAWIVLALSLVGCVPTVQLKSALLRGPVPTGVRFDAMLSIDNPNTFDIQVRTVRANVRMENVRGYIPVYFEPQMWIPANRKVMVALPVTVPWTMVPQILSASVSRPKVSYQVIGNADVTASRAFRIDRSAYEFDEDGELPRSMFLQIGGNQGPFVFGVGQPTR